MKFYARRGAIMPGRLGDTSASFPMRGVKDERIGGFAIDIAETEDKIFFIALALSRVTDISISSMNVTARDTSAMAEFAVGYLALLREVGERRQYKLLLEKA